MASITLRLSHRDACGRQRLKEAQKDGVVSRRVDGVPLERVLSVGGPSHASHALACVGAAYTAWDLRLIRGHFMGGGGCNIACVPTRDCVLDASACPCPVPASGWIHGANYPEEDLDVGTGWGSMHVSPCYYIGHSWTAAHMAFGTSGPAEGAFCIHCPPTP